MKKSNQIPTLPKLKHGEITRHRPKIKSIVNSINSIEDLNLLNPTDLVNFHCKNPHSKIELPPQSHIFNFNSDFIEQKNDFLEEALKKESQLNRKLHASAENQLRTRKLIKNYQSNELRQIQKREKLATSKHFKAKNEKTAEIIDKKNLYRFTHYIEIARGIEQIAQEDNLNTYLITLKCPQHLYYKSPKSITDHFNNQWKKITKGLKYFGLSSIEPHSDGTPHNHRAVICTHEIGEEIKRRTIGAFPPDPKIVAAKKKNWLAPHFQLQTAQTNKIREIDQTHLINPKTGKEIGVVEITFRYLLKTLHRENVGYGTFEKDGINKFQLLGQTYGITQLWDFTRTFEQSDLKTLLKQNPDSHLAILSNLVKNGDTAAYIRSINQKPRPKAITLVEKKKNEGGDEQEKTIFTIGFFDTSDNTFLTQVNMKRALSKSMLKNVKCREFFGDFFSFENRKPSEIEAYNTGRMPFIGKNLDRLEQVISFGVVTTPLTDEATNYRNGKAFTHHYSWRIGEIIEKTIENPTRPKIKKQKEELKPTASSKIIKKRIGSPKEDTELINRICIFEPPSPPLTPTPELLWPNVHRSIRFEQNYTYTTKKHYIK